VWGQSISFQFIWDDKFLLMTGTMPQNVNYAVKGSTSVAVILVF